MGFLKNNTLQVILMLLMFVNLNAQTDFRTVKDAFAKSYELEVKGDFKGAANEIKEVYNEESYESNLRLGWLNYMAGNFNESIAFYQKSMELMPYADEAKFGYIFPLSALGKWDEVIMVYKEVLANSKHNTKALYYLGTIYYNRKQYDKAITYFKQLIDLYPFDFDGLYMYAWSNLQLGNKKEAKILFQKALLNKPHDFKAIEGLGLTSH